MRLEESYEIKRILESLSADQAPRTCLNLGAGNIQHLSKQKPWIFENIFKPLKAKRCPTIHTDLFSWPGVDKVLDLTDPASLAFTTLLPGPKLFILANVLEHIPTDLRSKVCNTIASAMNSKDLLLVTVPYHYPYHPDPIDTMFRPSEQELKAFFNLTWLSSSIVECGSFKEELLEMNLPKRIRKLLKPLWPLRNPKKYLSDCHRLAFVFRTYKTTVVLGQKV